MRAHPDFDPVVLLHELHLPVLGADGHLVLPHIALGDLVEPVHSVLHSQQTTPRAHLKHTPQLLGAVHTWI